MRDKLRSLWQEARRTVRGFFAPVGLLAQHIKGTDDAREYKDALAASDYELWLWDSNTGKMVVIGPLTTDQVAEIESKIPLGEGGMPLQGGVVLKCEVTLQAFMKP